MQFIEKLSQKISINLFIYILSITAGIFTWRVMDIRNDWINVDSIIYLDAAKAIIQGHWHEAYQIYNWPFYPSLIALLAKIFEIDVLNSAKILNIIFFSITVFSLAKIVEQINPNKVTLSYLALLLFGSKYIAGSILPMLLRDQGFWACLTTATLFLTRFLSTRKFCYTLLWQFSIVLATLFRIEGAIYLAILPLTIFWLEKNKRVATLDFLKLNSWLLVAAIATLTALPFLDVSITQFGRLNEVRPETIAGSISSLFMQRSEAMQPILGEFLMKYDQFSLGVALVFITLAKMIFAISIPVLIICTVYASDARFNTKHLLPRHIKLILLAILTTVILTSFASILRSFVLSGRYLIPLAIFSIVVASVMLSNMLPAAKSFKRILLIAIIGLFGLQLAKNIWSKPINYNYEKVAIDYLNHQKIALNDVTILSPKASFYAHKAPIKIACASLNKWDCVSAYLEHTDHKSRFILVPIIVNKKTEGSAQFLKEKLPTYKTIMEFNNPQKNKKLILLENTRP